MSDQVAIMNRGAFEQVGTPRDLYYSPQTPFVASFVGDNNRWLGQAHRREDGGMQVRTEQGMELLAVAAGARAVQEGEAVEVFVRPEMIRLSLSPLEGAAEENSLEGRAVSLLFDGSRSQLLVRQQGSGQEILVNLPQSGEFAGLTAGDAIHLSWHSSCCHAFPRGS